MWILKAIAFSLKGAIIIFRNQMNGAVNLKENLKKNIWLISLIKLGGCFS